MGGALDALIAAFVIDEGFVQRQQSCIGIQPGATVVQVYIIYIVHHRKLPPARRPSLQVTGTRHKGNALTAASG